MTNKNQLIEEMAKDLKTCLPNNWYWQKTVDADTYLVARHFHNQGYRKVQKDSVVLSTEEYKILKVKEKEKHWLETCMSVWKNAKIDAIRETAKKILNEQYQECKVAERDVLIARGGNKNDDYYKGFSLGMTNTIMHIEELAEQFGVEIQEKDNG